ncbi:MAG: hypothetical protein OEW48_15835 [Phycisphaerae bacterium]|nr:hypothetical protein [Phycisphaerae bacterium]
MQRRKFRREFKREAVRLVRKPRRLSGHFRSRSVAVAKALKALLARDGR